MGVVEFNGIISLAQGTHLTMGVDIVALLHVLQDVVVVGRHPLGFQFVETALGTYLSAGSDEDLQFCIGEDGGADVATVHHNALVLAHLLLLGYHRRAYEADSRNGTDMVADFQGTDVVLHAYIIQIGVGTSCLWIELETDPDVRHLLFQLRCLHAAIGIEEMVLKCIEGDRTVHSARIYVDVAHFAGQILGHRALSA